MCSFMTLFNELNLKIMKLILYAVLKNKRLILFLYFVPVHATSEWSSKEKKIIELILGKNRVSRVVLLLL